MNDDGIFQNSQFRTGYQHQLSIILGYGTKNLFAKKEAKKSHKDNIRICVFLLQSLSNCTVQCNTLDPSPYSPRATVNLRENNTEN